MDLNNIMLGANFQISFHVNNGDFFLKKINVFLIIYVCYHIDCVKHSLLKILIMVKGTYRVTISVKVTMARHAIKSHYTTSTIKVYIILRGVFFSQFIIIYLYKFIYFNIGVLLKTLGVWMVTHACITVRAFPYTLNCNDFS